MLLSVCVPSKQDSLRLARRAAPTRGPILRIDVKRVQPKVGQPQRPSADAPGTPVLASPCHMFYTRATAQLTSTTRVSRAHAGPSWDLFFSTNLNEMSFFLNKIKNVQCALQKSLVNLKHPFSHTY